MSVNQLENADAQAASELVGSARLGADQPSRRVTISARNDPLLALPGLGYRFGLCRPWRHPLSASPGLLCGLRRPRGNAFAFLRGLGGIGRNRL